MVDRLVNSEVNSDRITGVENCFGLSGVPLNMPGRVLVGEGVLKKMCRKRLKARQFFLFNDILVYGNIVLKQKKYSRQRIIPLEEIKLENLVDDNILKNGWLMKTPTKSFAVYAATAIEKVEWMDHLQKCIQDLIRRTGKQPTGEHAAVWVPDSEATICMHCQKNQFTVLNRRHHCRSCGAVICGSCSKNKFLIPSQSSKPVRVCDSCYYKLGKGRTGAFSPLSIPPTEFSEQKPEIVNSVPQTLQTNNDLIDNPSNTDSSESEDEEKNDEILPEKPTFYSMSKSLNDSSNLSTDIDEAMAKMRTN